MVCMTCRHVHDWTDHVWAEVWSEAESRWLHVDPGEAVGKHAVVFYFLHTKDDFQNIL
jgi:hypothetical protein